MFLAVGEHSRTSQLQDMWIGGSAAGFEEEWTDLAFASSASTDNGAVDEVANDIAGPGYWTSISWAGRCNHLWLDLGKVVGPYEHSWIVNLPLAAPEDIDSIWPAAPYSS